MFKSKKSDDPTWKHCQRIDNNHLHVKCNYCGKAIWGGVARMKHHLAGTRQNTSLCPQCPEDVKATFLSLLNLKKMDGGEDSTSTHSSGIGKGDKKKVGSENLDSFVVKGGAKGGKVRQQTLNEMTKDRDAVCMDLCRFWYSSGLSFNAMKNPLFGKAIDSVANYGRGFKPPSYHEVRVTFLKKEVDRIVDEDLVKYKKEWAETGCTLMSDGWTDGKSRSITNFLVNSPSGTVFLESVDTSSIFKSGDELFKLLDARVEEIGEENVVQVVTDGASAYVAAGEKLMEKRKKIFWSPCAAHCINNMLKDIGDLPVHRDTIEKCKKVTVFIYRHCWVLNLMRKYTDGRELTRPAVTRFATNYLTLKSMLEQKIPLRAMFASVSWQKSKFAGKGDAVDVERTILVDNTFWKAIKFCLKSVLPLVKVLKLVDGDVKPAMGYIYEAMDRAKEQIERNFEYVKMRYEDVWTIIDARWGLQLHTPLHAAGYYLNPK
jgi:hypothetical protein